MLGTVERNDFMKGKCENTRVNQRWTDSVTGHIRLFIIKNIIIKYGSKMLSLSLIFKTSLKVSDRTYK